MSDSVLLQTEEVRGRLQVANEQSSLHLVQFGFQGGQHVQDI